MLGVKHVALTERSKAEQPALAHEKTLRRKLWFQGKISAEHLGEEK